MDKSQGEVEVERLLKLKNKNREKKYYGNWPLKDVPLDVIWNEFSNSNHRLSPETK